MFDMMLRLLDLEAKVSHILFKGPSMNNVHPNGLPKILKFTGYLKNHILSKFWFFFAVLTGIGNWNDFFSILMILK